MNHVFEQDEEEKFEDFADFKGESPIIARTFSHEKWGKVCSTLIDQNPEFQQLSLVLGLSPFEAGL